MVRFNVRVIKIKVVFSHGHSAYVGYCREELEDWPFGTAPTRGYDIRRIRRWVFKVRTVMYFWKKLREERYNILREWDNKVYICPVGYVMFNPEGPPRSPPTIFLVTLNGDMYESIGLDNQSRTIPLMDRILYSLKKGYTLDRFMKPVERIPNILVEALAEKDDRLAITLGLLAC